MEEEQALDLVLSRDNNFWIGLSDAVHEGTWRWQESDSEPSYTNWARGQPTNGGVGGNEDCGCKVCKRIADVDCKWDDAPCGSNFDHAHALCQIDK